MVTSTRPSTRSYSKTTATCQRLCTLKFVTTPSIGHTASTLVDTALVFLGRTVCMCRRRHCHLAGLGGGSQRGGESRPRGGVMTWSCDQCHMMHQSCDIMCESTSISSFCGRHGTVQPIECVLVNIPLHFSFPTAYLMQRSHNWLIALAPSSWRVWLSVALVLKLHKWTTASLLHMKIRVISNDEFWPSTEMGQEHNRKMFKRLVFLQPCW